MLKSGWHFPIPLVFLVVTIAYPEIFQIPIERSAVYATAILIVLSMAFGYRGNRVSPRQMLRAVLDTGRAALDIVLIGAAAGMVVGALSVSGISFGLTLQLIELSGHSLFVLLLLTAVISIILGMGMPTVSVYVLTATLLAPSLVKLGVVPMAAHMYVMYFGMLSMITPPVAIAAYAAANIARTSGWTTGWNAVIVGWSTFFIPFLFVLEPSLLMQGSPGLIAWQFARNLLGIFVGTAGIVGFAFAALALPMRIAFGAAALAILIPPHAFPGADLHGLDRACRRGGGTGAQFRTEPRRKTSGRAGGGAAVNSSVTSPRLRGEGRNASSPRAKCRALPAPAGPRSRTAPPLPRRCADISSTAAPRTRR